ncbi:MAG: hypothetical protein ISQ70_04635 [Pirellulales bacterium]|nr:hypothetical protein [Pirellulales bacterium]MBL7193943.1 hypothetical protein [Pirellulales bacterium]
MRELCCGRGIACGALAVFSLTLASCADYETAYQQSVENYTSGPPRAAAAAGGDASAAASPAAGGDAATPMSYGSGTSSGTGSGTGSSSGSGSQEGFSTIGSGASGVIVPGG